MSLSESLEALANAPLNTLDTALEGMNTTQLEALLDTIACTRFSVAHIEHLAAKELSAREWVTVEVFAPEFEALLNGKRVAHDYALVHLTACFVRHAKRQESNSVCQVFAPAHRFGMVRY